MQGALIVNSFLHTPKFTEHYEWLKKAAEQYDIALSLLENTDIMYPLYSPFEKRKKRYPIEDIVEQKDFILFWDKDIAYGKQLNNLCRQKGIQIFNGIEPIAIADNKFDTYLKIQEWNQKCTKDEYIPILPTIMAPMTYENIGYTHVNFVESVIEELGLPIVIKECYGSFGMQVYLAKTRQEVMDISKKMAGRPFLYQKYIKKSSGQDVRLQVVGNKVVAGMYRYSENGDFRANITNGGKMKEYKYSKKEEQLAIRTARALKLDFAGVDLLFSNGKEADADIVCEVNSNAHFKNIYLCTKVNVAKYIMEYIKNAVQKEV